eukprot:2389585-Pleurochrysis_carterae.AAC.2
MVRDRRARQALQHCASQAHAHATSTWRPRENYSRFEKGCTVNRAELNRRTWPKQIMFDVNDTWPSESEVVMPSRGQRDALLDNNNAGCKCGNDLIIGPRSTITEEGLKGRRGGDKGRRQELRSAYGWMAGRMLISSPAPAVSRNQILAGNTDVQASGRTAGRGGTAGRGRSARHVERMRVEQKARQRVDACNRLDGQSGCVCAVSDFQSC